MPNWCGNTVTITGKRSTVQRVRNYVHLDDQPFSLEAIDPTPEDKLLDDSWYPWRTSHWGTKWDVEAYFVDRIPIGDDMYNIIYIFDSAWGPPIGAIETLSKKFKTVEILITYDEPGNDFSGHHLFKAGEVLDFSEGPSQELIEYLEQEESD